jgi:hypothetical protein
MAIDVSDYPSLANCTPERYSPQAVRAALPAVWDESFLDGVHESTTGAYRYRSTRRCVDRSQASRRGTRWAVSADVRRAWHRARPTPRQRQAMLLVGGLDLGLEEAGQLLGTNAATVKVNFDRGVEHLLQYLQG